MVMCMVIMCMVTDPASRLPYIEAVVDFQKWDHWQTRVRQTSDKIEYLSRSIPSRKMTNIVQFHPRRQSPGVNEDHGYSLWITLRAYPRSCMGLCLVDPVDGFGSCNNYIFIFQCSSFCGPGKQIRRVSCIYTHIGQRTIPSLCPHKLRPYDRQPCEGTCGEGSGDFGDPGKHGKGRR